MQKILWVIIITLFFQYHLYAKEFILGDFKTDIFGTLYVDGFYTYSSENFEPIYSSMKIENGRHSFGSYAFTGSSKFGVTLAYKNISGTIEAGISDPVRKFYLKYNIGGSANHYILAGKDNNIAYYNFGQMSNDNQALIDYGTVSNMRRLQIRYGIQGFEIALIFPYIGFGSSNDMAYKGYFINDNMENTFIKHFDYMFKYIPRLEFAYTYVKNNFNIKFFASYGIYIYENTVLTDEMSKFNSTAHVFNAGFGGQTDFGNNFINYTFYIGQNMYLNDSNGVCFGNNSFLNPIFLKKNDSKLYNIDIKNILNTGIAFGYGYNAFDGKMVIQTGAGYSLNIANHYKNSNRNLGAFFNTRYYINDYFSLIPEFALLYNISGAEEKFNNGFSITAGIMAVLSF